jgi:HD superfamily phosphohydrolase
VHHPLVEGPELLRLDAGQGIVRIPAEVDVPFTARVQALVDTPEYRRLSQISQLGLVSRVYPGATHTRFEHALGVFHNALRYLWQLGKDPRFCEVVDVHTAEVLLVAALLHDLGHWPFCHPIEDLGLVELPPHEDLAAQFLAPDRELAQVLREEWHVAPEEVLDVLSARTQSPQMRLMRSILSGPIDIDKMDYLERDSLHAGVPYGRNFDKNRLIQSLLLNEAGDGLAISSKGKTAAELMVFARYVMFSEVYWHHAVRSATAMFARAFFELRHTFDLRAMFQMSEADTVTLLRRSAQNTPAQELVEGIFGSRRQLYKRLTEAGLSQNRELYDLLARQPFARLVDFSSKLAQTFGRVLGEPVQPTEVLIDGPPAHREVEFRIDLYYAKEQAYRPLHQVSPVVAALAQTQFDDYVKRVRIYAHPRIARRLQALPNLPRTIAEALSQGHFSEMVV